MMGIMGNSVEFRKMGKKRWIDIHEYDLVLEEIVKGERKYNDLIKKRD